MAQYMILIYEDEAQFSHVQELLAPYPNVILLLPSADLEESLTIVRERGGFIRDGMPANRFYKDTAPPPPMGGMP